MARTIRQGQSSSADRCRLGEHVMKTNKRCFAVRASVVAVQNTLAALVVMSSAQAAEGDNAARQLTQPTNQVEVGGGYVSQDSFKFGQYNGLFNKGFYGVLNIDVRSADAPDSDSAVRWRVNGTDLGLDTRRITAEVGQQGKFRINVGFDELRSNRSDTYQTPYSVSYTHLRAHETDSYLVCRLLLEK